MNKKQGIIIATLLVLIVCAGVLATKLNNPLYVNGDDSGSGKSSAVSFNNNDKKNSKVSSFFEETRLSRDNKNTQTLQTLKNLIDDKNISKENRDEATKKYTELAMNTNNESKIETALKGKGYEEAICSIEENKVTVIVKGKDKLTDKDTREIKNVVMGIAKIQDVEIQVKQ